MLDDVLKDSGAARKLALSLEHVHYGDKLKQELMNFSAQMEGLYRKLQQLILKKVTKAKKYDPILIDVEAKNAWYKTAEAGHSQIREPAQPNTLSTCSS